MFQDFEHHHIPVAPDIRIHCVTAGNPQRPPVLLLHGYPQNLSMWAQVAPKIAERYRVVCADLRGYGDSSKPLCTPTADNYSFRAMAADQVAVMRALGHEQFHVIGHDRGARTSHRMALDHPDRVLSLAVLDIVPTYDMFMRADRQLAAAYWHWYFLQQPAGFLETLIGAAPDVFYETSLVGWGATKLEAFDPVMLADYRRCWRTREFIHGSSSDYRAAATIDLALDTADLTRQLNCPTLALWGTHGHLPKFFDLGALWAERCTQLRCETLAAGHFLIDQQPRETTAALLAHLHRVAA